VHHQCVRDELDPACPGVRCPHDRSSQHDLHGSNPGKQDRCKDTGYYRFPLSLYGSLIRILTSLIVQLRSMETPRRRPLHPSSPLNS
jgi:hypothetical protein